MYQRAQRPIEVEVTHPQFYLAYLQCAFLLSNQITTATQTVVNSWSQICHTLMRAEDGWWQGNDDEDSENMDDDASNGSAFFETPAETYD